MQIRNLNLYKTLFTLRFNLFIILIGYLLWLFIAYSTLQPNKYNIDSFNATAIPLAIFSIIGIGFDAALIKDRINDNNFAETSNEIKKPLNKLVQGITIKIILPLASYLIGHIYILNHI